MNTPPYDVAHVVATELERASMYSTSTSSTLYDCNSGCLWEHIFEYVFGRKPSGVDDPGWDILFSEQSGYGALHVAMNHSP